MSNSATVKQLLPPLELHTCMGLNSCENRGFQGDNACAGQGDCATISHPCHTLNDCKGQGGCGLFGTTKEFCTPGANDCRYQGSCGSPIVNSRFISQGPNKGRSVCILARKVFEDRMTEQNIPFGEPYENQTSGPTLEFVKQRGYSTSCGQSGNRNCSYAFDPATRAKQKAARQAKLDETSQQDLHDTIDNCDCD